MSGGAFAVERLSLRLGEFVLDDIDLHLDPGETLVLLGPNGAGKSVILETIAGFHRPARGRIVIAGRDVTALPPERRQVALMPQNYGLFPHLSVAENVALPLRSDHGRRTEAVAKLLRRFGVADLAGRLPQQLSPGERQRAALARALAARPKLFLFDEPFAALDAPTRAALADELREFLRQAGIPALFVTHDLGEAMGLADRLAAITAGRVRQQGRADDVYRRPASVELARLLGVENILRGRLTGAGRAEIAGVSFRTFDAGAESAGDISLAIRAEDVALLPGKAAETGTDGNRLAATVRAVMSAGALVRVSLDCGFPLVARLTRREAEPLGLAPGRGVIAEIAAADVRLLQL